MAPFLKVTLVQFKPANQSGNVSFLHDSVTATNILYCKKNTREEVLVIYTFSRSKHTPRMMFFTWTKKFGRVCI